MNLPATSVNPDKGGSVAPGMAALAQLAFAASAPAATRVADDAAAAFAPASNDALDLDLSDPDQCRFGDYTLLGKLGQGGMGVVYRAQQHSLDREVAVKLLAAGPWASPGFIERFRLEAQSAARMQHPNIVTIHEIGEQDGLPFFSMRLVRGQSLAEHMQKQGPLPARRAAALLRTVAEAVDYAHRLGVLHLDLKPGNVLIDEHGEPMVADFGLARRLEGTLAGVVEEVSGTPSYMAPEQATAGGRIGICTDVYALGATLFESLTGRPPFRGATARETLEQVVHAAAPSPRSFERSVPLDLQAICMRCLRKDPAERYPSARALADDLAEFLRGREVKARPLNRPQKLMRMVRREPRLSALVLLFVGSLLLGLFATTVQWNRADASASSARESLWRERTQAAEIALADGNGFHGLQAMVANVIDMESAGAKDAAAVERQRIGTLLANAPRLVDRIPLEEGQVATSVALAPDGQRVAVATHWPDGRRSVRQHGLADGTLQWSIDTGDLTHNLSIAHGAPHGRLRYSADGARVVASLIQQPVFAAPGTPDEIAIDARDGHLLRPAQLPQGFSDFVFDDQAQRAIVRWRTQPALRFPDRFRFHEVDGWRPVGPEHADTSSMWLFAPDGSWLLRTRDFQHFEAVEFGSLALRWQLTLADAQLARAWRFAADGTLALGLIDGGVLLVDAASGAVDSLPSAPTETVRWLEFAPDGATLAALSEHGQLVAWDLRTRQARMAPLRFADMRHLGRVHLFGDQLALVHGNAIGLWQLPPLAPFGNDPMPTAARILGRRPYNAHAFDVDPARRLLVSGGSEGVLAVWRLPEPPLRPERAAPLAPETPVFDGRHLVAVAGSDVRVVSLPSGAATGPALRHEQAVDFAELSHDGRWLVTIAARTLRVFDAASGKPHGEPMVLPATPLRAELARAAPLLVLVYGSNENGRYLERAQAVDLEAVRSRADGLELPPMVHLIRVDPQGRYLLAASGLTPLARLLDLGGAPACNELTPAGVNPIEAMALSPDGRVAWLSLAPGTRRSAVLRWDLESCAATGVYENNHLGMTPYLEALEDGVLLHRHFAAALAWVGSEGLRSRVPTLAAASAMGLVAVSADGRRAALATRNAVQVYDLRLGELLSSPLTAPLAGNDAIRSLVFAPDGSRLLARSIFGRWVSWPLAPATEPAAELEQLAMVLDPASATRQPDAGQGRALRARLRAAGGADASTTASTEAAPVLLGAVAQAGVDAHFRPIDLGRAYNVRPGHPWIRMAAQGGDLFTLAPGVHRLDAVDWRIEGAVQLSGGGPALSLHPYHPYSEWVPFAPIAASRAHLLMLIHVPMRPRVPPRRAGVLELRHADGSLSALEIQSVRDVVTHWQPDLAAASARVAWRGASPTSLREGENFHGSHIYHVALDLPEGASPVVALRLGVGDGPMEAPLFYAVTLEVDSATEGGP